MATNKTIHEKLNANKITTDSSATTTNPNQDEANEPKTLVNSGEQMSIFSPGEQLKQVRESRKITLDEIAKKILINKQILVHLENDNYDGTAGPAYARGYLRSYAQYLKLPEESILKSFEQTEWYKRNNGRVMTVLQAQKNSSTSSNNEQSSHWIVYTGIAILLLGTFFAWQKHHDTVLQPEATAQPVAAPNAVTTQTTNAVPIPADNQINNQTAISTNSAPTKTTTNVVTTNNQENNQEKNQEKTDDF